MMAKDDLNSARNNFENKNYYVCAFLSQQAVEKTLKSLKLLKKCEELSKVYIETRYGALGEYTPSQKFRQHNTLEYLEIAEEIIKWAEKNI
jgi:HEPN domain-containing protein